MTVASLVMKFGGTSVADAEAIARVVRIVKTAWERSEVPPVVVVSAMSGVTDRLLALARLAEQRRTDEVAALVGQLHVRHIEAVQTLLSGIGSGPLAHAINLQFEELRTVLHGIAILREASPSALDAVAATGELVNSRIVAAAMNGAGVSAEWVDARRVVVTDSTYTAAAPLTERTVAAVTEEIFPVLAGGRAVVVGGFVGATISGVTTTLGRGGSDYSAAIVGAALDAREIQIWTDVDGMLTADPRVVRDPRVVPHISFTEASELAYFGAKVLHPSTILPAVAKDIPVRILNSRRPEVAGTLITATGSSCNGPIAAVACKRKVTMVEVTSTRMLMAYGFLRRVFEVFERHHTSVDVVTTSEVSVSMTLDDDARLDEVVASLEEFADVAVERDLAILCAVGDNLRADARLAGRILAALDGFPLRMVSQAASRRNVTVVLSDEDLPRAMARVHDQCLETSRVER